MAFSMSNKLPAGKINLKKGAGMWKPFVFKRSFTLLDTKKEERKKPASPRVCQAAAAAVATVRRSNAAAATICAAPPCDRLPPLPRGKLDTSPHTTVLAWHSGKISRPTELLTDFYPRYPAWDLWTFLTSTVALCKHIIVVIRRSIK